MKPAHQVIADWWLLPTPYTIRFAGTDRDRARGIADDLIETLNRNGYIIAAAEAVNVEAAPPAQSCHGSRDMNRNDA